MRSVYFARDSKTSVDSVMTPMIDVVFLLLIFFLSTASFQRLEKNLSSSVASAPEKKQQGASADSEPPKGLSDLSDIIVAIRSSKADRSSLGIAYQFNGEPMADLPSLRVRLENVLRIRADVPIIVDPESNVPAGEAIRVYDLAKSLGSTAVYFVAR